MEFGTKIAELRLKQNISQEELASRLFVSKDLVSKWENNKRCPNFEMIERLCDIFFVEKEYFETQEEALIRELEKCLPKANNITPEAFVGILNSFMETLSERDRNVFVRRFYFMEMPEQIGERYIMKTANVNLILYRVKKKLCKYLMERSE